MTLPVLAEYQPAGDRYDGMPYRRCGRGGLKLPVISLGLWHNFGGVDAFEKARAVVRRAFDFGVTHFDLANNYGPPPGSAEETYGRILRGDLRGRGTVESRVLLCDHCQDFCRKLGLDVELFLGTAEALPFKDNAFESIFHVGGINFFSDKKTAIDEMIRVARPGTKIAAADENGRRQGAST